MQPTNNKEFKNQLHAPERRNKKKYWERGANDPSNGKQQAKANMKSTKGHESQVANNTDWQLEMIELFQYLEQKVCKRILSEWHRKSLRKWWTSSQYTKVEGGLVNYLFFVTIHFRYQVVVVKNILSVHLDAYMSDNIYS